MKKPIKKIIAREGLVIAAFIVAFTLILLIPPTITLKNIDTSKASINHKQLTLVNRTTGTSYTILSSKSYLEKTVPIKGRTFPREDVLKELAKRGRINSKNLEKHGTIVKEVLSTSQIKDKLILILFLLYPFHLLVRFIFWAVRTLKEK